MSMLSASYPMKRIVGLVLALLLAVSVTHATAATIVPSAMCAGVNCLHHDVKSHDSVPGHMPCGGASDKVCVSHAGCIAVTLSAASPESRRTGVAQWPWPDIDSRVGRTLLPETPPPQPFA